MGLEYGHVFSPVFGGTDTSKPINLVGYERGSIITAGSVSFASIGFRTIKADRWDDVFNNPGTLIQPRDAGGSLIGALTIGANAAQILPADLFQYPWLVLVANANVAADSQIAIHLK